MENAVVRDEVVKDELVEDGLLGDTRDDCDEEEEEVDVVDAGVAVGCPFRADTTPV